MTKTTGFPACLPSLLRGGEPACFGIRIFWGHWDALRALGCFGVSRPCRSLGGFAISEALVAWEDCTHFTDLSFSIFRAPQSCRLGFWSGFGVLQSVSMAVHCLVQSHSLVPFSSSGLCSGGFESNSSVGRAKS